MNKHTPDREIDQETARELLAALERIANHFDRIDTASRRDREKGLAEIYWREALKDARAAIRKAKGV